MTNIEAIDKALLAIRVFTDTRDREWAEVERKLQNLQRRLVREARRSRRTAA